MEPKKKLKIVIATQAPIPVQAYQWFPDLGPTPGIVQITHEDMLKSPIISYCSTLTGLQRVLPGSWVIRHPSLGFYTVDPEIFSDAYTIKER